MVEVERIWRIRTSAESAVQLRLAGSQGQQRVILEEGGAQQGDGSFFDVEVARAMAQAMLEACEVASALE